jgi:hypothetical protein
VDKVEALVQAGAKWKEEVMTVDDMILMGLTQSPKDGSQVCLSLAILSSADGTGDYPHLRTSRSWGCWEEAMSALL